jgi:NADPH2:quinone reductase
MSGITNPIGKLRKGLAFGLYHPAEFLMDSQSMIGVNMLRIADHRQDVIAWCLEGVVQGFREGWLEPKVGARFNADQIAEAQTALETRKTTGKVVVSW